jgi:hypothetical protein
MFEILYKLLPLITAIFTAFWGRENAKGKIKRSKYIKVIFPVYLELQGILYKDITKMDDSDYTKLELVRTKFKRYSYLVGVEYIHYIKETIDNKSQTAYDTLCYSLSNYYDRYSSLFDIGKRTLKYKETLHLDKEVKEHNQYLIFFKRMTLVVFSIYIAVFATLFIIDILKFFK